MWHPAQQQDRRANKGRRYLAALTEHRTMAEIDMAEESACEPR